MRAATRLSHSLARLGDLARTLGRGNKDAPPPPGQLGREALRARREALVAEFARRQYDLGGLVYEMAARDHIRLDIVLSKAAELQQLDWELAAVEWSSKLGEQAAAGACPGCGRLFPEGAVFCPGCGRPLSGVNAERNAR